MPQSTNASFQYELLGRLGLPPIAELVSDSTHPCSDQATDTLPERLYQLQCDSSHRHSDWLALEYSMQRLLEQLAGVPPYSSAAASAAAPARRAHSDNWWVEVGPVDFGGDVITLEREGYLLAALAPNEEGRLRLTAYRPLDARSLGLLVALAAHPHPRHGVAMRENNWLLAVDTAAEPDHFLASEQGEAYLAHWPRGLGEGGAAEAPWQAPLSGLLVEIQLKVFEHFRDLDASAASRAS